MFARFGRCLIRCSAMGLCRAGLSVVLVAACAAGCGSSDPKSGKDPTDALTRDAVDPTSGEAGDAASGEAGDAPSGGVGHALEWAVWSATTGNSSTGSFSSGRSVLLTGHFGGISGGEPAAAEYTTDKPIPGTSGNANPSFIRSLTGTPHPVAVNVGDQVIIIDLATFPVDADSTFGLADLQYANGYKLRLTDAAMSPLPLDGVRLTSYNITYQSGLKADQDVLLEASTGAITVNAAHDDGGSYSHSGLTTFNPLPMGTRYIVLLNDKVQQSEGFQIYLAGSVSTDSTDAGQTPGK